MGAIAVGRTRILLLLLSLLHPRTIYAADSLLTRPLHGLLGRAERSEDLLSLRI